MLAPALRTHWRTLAACVCVSSVADLGIWIRPVVVGTLVEQRGLSVQSSGAIGSAEIVAFSVTMILCARFARSFSFRSMSAVGFMLVCLMSAASIVTEGVAQIMAVRVIAAIGLGVLSTVSYAVASTLPEPQKVFGVLFAGGAILCSLIIWVMPHFGPMVGPNHAFVVFLAYALLVAPALLALPVGEGERFESSASEAKSSRAVPWRQIVLLAAAFSIQSIAVQGVWNFFTLFADKVGMTGAGTAMCLSLITIASVLGSLASDAVVKASGRRRAVLVAGAVAAMLIGALILARSPLPFASAAILLYFVLFALYPAVFGIAADLDHSGRGATFVQGTAMLIGALGPLLVGALMGVGRGWITGVTTAIMSIAWALFYHLFRESPARAIAQRGERG